jgi:hypothetical protein
LIIVEEPPIQSGGWRCACRECHPGRSGGMFVLVEDAAEAVASRDVQAVSRFGLVIGSGSRASGRALAMP